MAGMKGHWDRVYSEGAEEGLGWFQERATVSVGLIGQARIGVGEPVIDIGGGASRLVDELLEAGFHDVTVLDISGAALQIARDRLGDRAALVRWLEADITTATLPAEHFALWHDRAVFHFLTDAADRRKYVDAARRSVRLGGTVIIATFAADGPTQCSGLDVVRSSADQISGEIGDAFTMIDHRSETHRTPAGDEQSFAYAMVRKVR